MIVLDEQLFGANLEQAINFKHKQQYEL